MKRTLFVTFIAFIICELQVSGQIIKDPITKPVPTVEEVYYTYDAAGNRINRKIIQVLPVIVCDDDDDDDDDLETDDDDDELEIRSGGYIEDPETDKNKGFSNANEREIHVYPNPVREEVTIEIWNGEEEDNYRQLFYDSAGKLLIDKKRQGNGKEPVDMSQYATGIYLLIINYNDGKKEYKIVKE